MKRVLLTGANGFLGRQAILPLLERGYDIHAVSNVVTTDDPAFSGVTWHETDLLNATATNEVCRRVRASHLLHFAWYVEHGKFWNAPENRKWVTASENLLSGFRKYGGDRVVMAGTCAEYKWGTDTDLSEVTTPLEPAGLYGKCKVELQTKLAASGSSWAWGRVFFLYGEYESQRRLVASVINSLLRDEFADCSHGEQIRDLMYVRDAADAFASLLDSQVEGCVNVASGDSTTLKNVVSLIADKLQRSDKVRLGTLPPEPDEPLRIVADVSRLRDEVRWEPNYTLSQGIDSTIEWWRKKSGS